MNMDNLNELFHEQIRDLYDAEQQLVKALPMMAEAATNQQLKDGFQRHLEQTMRQIERLEQVFNEIGEKPSRKTCDGMKGIIKEGQEIINKQGMDNDVKDAALIGAAQHAEHYEIAGYGTVRAWAEALGLERSAKLLQQTLDEEYETDKKLTKLAETHINEKAQA